MEHGLQTKLPIKCPDRPALLYIAWMWGFVMTHVYLFTLDFFTDHVHVHIYTIACMPV